MLTSVFHGRVILVSMKSLPPRLGTARLPFLVQTPARIAVDRGHVRGVRVGALCAHIRVNAFSAHLDLRSRFDVHTEKTPFSSIVLQRRW